MQLPPFYNLVRITAQIGAAIGCILGTITILGAFTAFNFGLVAGITAISGGIYIILASLTGLGVAYGFLAIVKAQIDCRNALVVGIRNDDKNSYIEQGKREPII